MILFLICILLCCKVFRPPRSVDHKQARQAKKAEPQKEIDYELAYELQQRLAHAKEEIQHYRETVAKLSQEEAELSYKLDYYKQLHLPCKVFQEKHEKLLEKVWSEKQKLSKAELNKISIERRLNKCISK